MHPRRFLFLILLCAFSGLCFGQSGAQVLQSTLQKMGGKERWQALRSLEVSYRQETQRVLRSLGEEELINREDTELKYCRYLDMYGSVSKNGKGITTLHRLVSQDSSFTYAFDKFGREMFDKRKIQKTIDTVLFHIQNVEFLPLLILDCLQGKVAYEYEGLRGTAEKHHSFWLSYQGYANRIHLLIYQDFTPYKYELYQAGQEKFYKSRTFVKYQTHQGLWLPSEIKEASYLPQEISGMQIEASSSALVYLQSVKTNEAPPEEVLKILKR
jgi:hypothetical protein